MARDEWMVWARGELSGKCPAGLRPAMLHGWRAKERIVRMPRLNGGPVLVDRTDVCQWCGLIVRFQDTELILTKEKLKNA